jgi:hypothetical protein
MNVFRDTEISEFLRLYPPTEELVPFSGSMYKHSLHRSFEKQLKFTIKNKRKREKQINLHIKNSLLNCIRKWGGIVIVSFEEEYPNRQELEEIKKKTESKREIEIEKLRQEINKINENMEFFSPDEQTLNKNRIKKLEENIREIQEQSASESESESENKNVCDNCGAELITNVEGYIACVECGKVFGAVEGTSFQQSTGLAGTKMLETTAAKQAESLSRTAVERRAAGMIQMIHDYIRRSKYEIINVLQENDNFNVSIRNIIFNNPNDSPSKLKIKIIQMFIKHLVSLKCQIIGEILQEMKQEFRIKKDLTYLLDPDYENRTNIDKLFELISEYNIQSNENIIEVAAIVKDILVKEEKNTQKDAEKKIKKASGLPKSKYENEYIKIKNKNKKYKKKN